MSDQAAATAQTSSTGNHNSESPAVSNPGQASHDAYADSGNVDEDAELEAMKARMAEMEAEAAKLREMTTQSDAAAASTSPFGTDPSNAGAGAPAPRPPMSGPTDEEKEEVDARSIYVGNVRPIH